MNLLPAIEFDTGPDPNFCVIWLHGLGADGNDFAPIVPALKLPAQPSIRFIFPHAPQMPVTVNGGMVMPAWYDILEMQIERRVDVDGLLASAASIDAFVDRPLCGLLAMSTYCAACERLQSHAALTGLPIEIHHGLYDPVVPERLGKEASAFLEEHGYAPVYRTYPMEHQVCAEQIGDISNWLQAIIK